MGNESSSSTHSSHSKDLAAFSSTEQVKVVQFYKNFGVAQTENPRKILKKYLKDFVSVWLAERLSEVLSLGFHTSHSHSKSSSHFIPAHSFYSSLSYLLIGTVEQQATVLIRLTADSPSDSTATTKGLTQLITEILRSYFILVNRYEEEHLKSWCRSDPEDEELSHLADYLLSDLFFTNRKQKVECGNIPPDKSFNTEDLITWLNRTNVIIPFMNYVMAHTFPVLDTMEKSFLPVCLGRRPRIEHTDLLSLVSVLMITQSLPANLRDKWTLLFDSRQHGESFTNMLRNVKQQKDTVLIIRDKGGHVFGGFSTAVWSNHAAFQGSNNNFLFSLHPRLDVYKPTGLNTNYFYLNSGQETLPNGMGMGGQFEYFGLWLDNEFGSGHSMAKPLSTTYHSPTLSSEPHFQYDDLEVWRVSGLLEDETDDVDVCEAKAPTSILDSDAGAKAILNMVGRGNLSEGLRESDPTASNPEEHEKPIV